MNTLRAKLAKLTKEELLELVCDRFPWAIHATDHDIAWARYMVLTRKAKAMSDAALEDMERYKGQHAKWWAATRRFDKAEALYKKADALLKAAPQDPARDGQDPPQ